MVVLADEARVRKFPIPLLSRLEKHYISSTSLLNDSARKAHDELLKWMKSFTEPHREYRYSKCGSLRFMPNRN